MTRGSENLNYEDCEALYRAAKSEERPSAADRHAVRLAVMASVAATVQLATAGSASAALSSATSGAVAPHMTTGVGTGTGTGVGTGTSTGAAIGTGTGVAAGTGLATGSATSALIGAKGLIQLLAGGKFLTGLLVGAVVGTVGSAAAFVAMPPTHSASKVTAPVNMPTQGQRARALGAHPELPAELRDRTVQPAIAELPPHPVTEAPLVQSVTSVSTNVPAPSVATSDRLLEETRALAKVQEALSRNAPGEAFALLRDQERRYPAGQLVQERAAARVLAMCALGNAAEASKARSQFLTAYPDSPLTNRVLTGCSP